MAVWLLVVVGWVSGAAYLYSSTSPDLGSGAHAPVRSVPTTPVTPAPGEVVTINGGNETRQIVCDGNDVTVNGAANRVDVTGHCRSLTVSGSGNQVSVDVADTITANGINDVITYRAGSPRIIDVGIDNVGDPG